LLPTVNNFVGSLPQKKSRRNKKTESHEPVFSGSNYGTRGTAGNKIIGL